MNQEPISSNEDEQVSPQEQLSDDEIVRLVEQERGAVKESRVPLIAFLGALISCVIILPTAFARLHPTDSALTAPAPRWVNWTYSFEEAQARAHKNNQKIFIDFYTDWCPSCKWMDSSVYTQPEVLAETPNIVTVKINAEGRTDLAQRYNIHVYPSLVWTDADGNELGRNDGSLQAPELAERLKQYH